MVGMSDLFRTLCQVRQQYPDPVRVELDGHRPSLSLWTAGSEHGPADLTIALPCPSDSWSPWGIAATAEWWQVSAPEVSIVAAGQPMPRRFLVTASHVVWSDPTTGAVVYTHAGTNRLYWVGPYGVEAWETLPAALGSAYAVVAPGVLDVSSQARIRSMILGAPSGTWKLPAETQESSTLIGTMVISDCLVDGVSRPLVDETAAWLRHTLPTYKVGAPSIEDVRLKLDLERRLRIEDKVVGSSRPLAFTLQAIEDVTFPWPGLWLVSGTLQDFRVDLPILLAWDAVLAAVAAVSRLHVDVKPGLCYSSGLSATVLRTERRFSKRDIGATESAYCQVNPSKILGSASVVATRLLQAATHELTHVSLHQFPVHSELFAARREQLFLTTSELMPAVMQLVERLGVDRRPARTIILPPILMETWLEEMLRVTPEASVPYLAKSWASVRNLTDGRARRDVADMVGQAVKAGRFEVVDDAVVRVGS